MTDAAAFPNEHFDLTSATNGRSYRVSVEAPNRYRQGNKAYPLVVVLDGQWVFGIVQDAFRILPLERELPEAVVVGIAHNPVDVRQLLQDRAADFTPTQADAPAQTGVRLPADQVGGAATFRRILLDELLPPVEERYRLNGDRALVGHSFSALFGLDTLLHAPGAFDRWVLASPSVWWDDQVMFRREEATEGDVWGRVFLSAGEHEGFEPPFGGHHDFYRQLAGRQHPGLDLTWHLFPGEGHNSVTSASVIRGLRTVFSKLEA